MAINSVGYEGSINETQWAQLAGMIGTRFAAAGYNDWRPTIVTGADRTIRFAAGVLYGDGVLDTNTANIDVQAPSVSSGARWDTFVARRDWTPSGGGTTTVVRLGGTSTQALAALQNTPGTIADEPLALAEFVAGQQTARTLIDLRTWASKVVTAESLLAASLQPLGAEVIVGDARYRRTRNGSNVETTLVGSRTLPGALTSVTFDATGYAVVPHNLGFQPSALIPVPRFGAGSRVLVAISTGSNPISTTSVALRAVDTADGSPFTGTLSRIDFIASV